LQESRSGAVTVAVTLLYATLGIGILRFFLDAPDLLEEASGRMGASGVPALPVVVLTALVGLSVMWLFIYAIGRGRNWARLTFLVLFLLGIPFSVLPLLQSLASNPTSGILGVGQAVLQVIALILLFQPRSSEWFKQPIKMDLSVGRIAAGITTLFILAAAVALAVQCAKSIKLNDGDDMLIPATVSRTEEL
jgi:membrane-bound ClpP family serine protease